VLDIGVVSHSARYFDLPDWRHGRIHKAASYCVGIDILEPLVAELNGRGFNVRCVDATSDADMGERFDVIFIGDVVEHVDNAVLLLKFAARHLAPGGRLYVTTPNPFSRKFFRQFKREGVMVVNLDHIAWITPTLAMELARRAGIALAAYHLVKRFSPSALLLKRLVGWRLEPVEFSFPDYLYEFVRRD
jgi:2-polyprenyl-3-methyl-5-hydroxy-6-metoxy-1,4-benzoquinol methylase